LSKGNQVPLKGNILAFDMLSILTRSVDNVEASQTTHDEFVQGKKYNGFLGVIKGPNQKINRVTKWLMG